MFGRRRIPFGSAGAAASPPPPPPPSGKETFPIEKMDRALDGAIRLLTRCLDDAGARPGALAIRGAVPDNVSAALADCTTYRGQEDGSQTYLALGLTQDFKAFMYPPHCCLFMIINATLLAEDPLSGDLRNSLALSQFKGPLIDAQLMRRWIRFILPTSDAMRGGGAALSAHMTKIMDALAGVLRDVPPEWHGQVNLKEHFDQWAGGFPGTIGHPLTDEVQRMNGLPVTPFIGETLTKFLADLQMRGISQRG